MRVCQFRHYGTMNTMKGSAERRYDLDGHAFLFGLQMDCNTRVRIIEWTAKARHKAWPFKFFRPGLLRIAQGADYILAIRLQAAESMFSTAPERFQQSEAG